MSSPFPSNPHAHTRAPVQVREYRQAVERIAREVDGPVLDWGCGLGQVTVMLRAAGVDVTSFDWKEDAEGVQRRALHRYPQVEAWVSDDPVRLPFEDDRFAAVLSMGVLEHVHDPDGSLEEIRRVLRPGGVLYVYKLPNRASWLEWVARRAGMYHHGVDPNDRLYTLAEAEALVGRHGFAVSGGRRRNMLPLSLPQIRRERLAAAVWGLSGALERVPGLNRLATNVELVARAR